MKFFPTIDLEATGRQIVRLRKEKGLTVRDMQRYFGFDAPQAIYKWQKGLTLPSVDNLYALSRLLEVPMERILVQSDVTVNLMTEHEPKGSVFFVFGFSGQAVCASPGMPGSAPTPFARSGASACHAGPSADARFPCSPAIRRQPPMPREVFAPIPHQGAKEKSAFSSRRSSSLPSKRSSIRPM